ncbi:nucleotidyltransferase family protein [Spirulina subsalsa]|uniref:nucleotidyltransferase family protein n=1 Tax=Spirulina subsalsa TaxID=54311 RepID=UPI0002E6E0DD|nr:nucleotidyltransferase domain-containing protein [Spirulina subsalsa]
MYTLQKTNTKIFLDYDCIVAACQKWKIIEFALFGSVLRDDFQPDRSDVDVLVVFHRDAHWTLFDLVDIEDDFKKILGRDVDLVERESIEKSDNPFRKQEILNSLKVIYAAS